MEVYDAHMSKRSRIRVRLLYLGCLTMLFLCQSCTPASKELDPNKLLSYAISSIAGEDHFAFSASTALQGGGQRYNEQTVEGSVVSHNKLYIRSAGVVYTRRMGQWKASGAQAEGAEDKMPGWNPVSLLERLNRMDKSVKLDRAASQGDKLVLLVYPNKEQSKQFVVQEMDRQLSRITPEQQISDAKPNLRLSPSDRAKLTAELQRLILQSQQTWQEVKRSLKAEERLILTMDRKSYLPLQLHSETMLSYKGDGKLREETRFMDYTFRNYGKTDSSLSQ